MNQTQNKTPAYIPALDGLRAIAVFMVIAVHYINILYPGGFIGVDIFFVLSGYLITKLLLDEFQQYRAINLKYFWIRRFLRLLPALYLMLIVLNLWHYFIFQPGDTSFFNETRYIVLYISNWVYALELSPSIHLAHTWSLAIEEQFYLVWPLLLVILLKFRTSTLRILLLTLVIALASYILRLILLGQGVPMHHRLDFATDTHIGGLVLGASLALLYASPKLEPILLRLRAFINHKALFIPELSLVLLLLMGFSVTSRDPLTYIIYLPLATLLSCFLLIHLLSPQQSLLRRILENRFLVYTGKISYGIYLWHYVLFSLIYPYFPLPRIVTLLLVYLICSISYWTVERSAMKLKNRFRPA